MVGQQQQQQPAPVSAPGPTVVQYPSTTSASFAIAAANGTSAGAASPALDGKRLVRVRYISRCSNPLTIRLSRPVQTSLATVHCQLGPAECAKSARIKFVKRKTLPNVERNLSRGIWLVRQRSHRLLGRSQCMGYIRES